MKLCRVTKLAYCEITRQYYERYRLPVMHTETNTWQGPKGDKAAYWLWKEWANVLRLRNPEPVPDTPAKSLG